MSPLIKLNKSRIWKRLKLIQLQNEVQNLGGKIELTLWINNHIRPGINFEVYQVKGSPIDNVDKSG